MDPRRMVNIISRNKRNNQKLKQEAVQDYIDHMAGVDKSDQLMSYTPFHRKTMKWWKKMFFHLFTLSIIQSSILHEIYHTGRGGKKLPLKQFVVRLGLAMNDRYQAGVAAAAAGQAAANPPVPAVAPPAPVPAAAPPPPVPVAAPPPPVPAAVGQTRLVGCGHYSTPIGQVESARSEERGQEAIKALEAEGLRPKFHQLDIDDAASIDRLGAFLADQYGGLDLLVNNAGIAYKVSSTAPFPKQAEVTVATNFWGTLNVCDRLFPLLKPHARVCNVSSMASTSSYKKCSSQLQAKLKDPNLTMDDLKELMKQFVSAAQKDAHEAAGWPNSAYGTSKVGVTVMTRIQQQQLDAAKKEDILVNACCPGYVDTDMSSHKGTKTIDQGAETPMMLALLPANDPKGPRGKFFSEKNEVTW
ncbi:hypothetical protein ACOMHN_012871 [Nucella lapillus]